MSEFFYESAGQILIFFLLGFFLGFLYDFFRILRLTRKIKSCQPMPSFFQKMAPPGFFSPAKKHPLTQKAENVLVFAEDILFFVICAVLYNLLVYISNEGEIRLWGIVFLFIGFIVYLGSLSLLIIRFADFILFFPKILISWTYYCIMKLVKPLAGFFDFCKKKRAKKKEPDFGVSLPKEGRTPRRQKIQRTGDT